jgi:ornithine carbamoyltransferase
MRVTISELKSFCLRMVGLKIRNAAPDGRQIRLSFFSEAEQNCAVKRFEHNLVENIENAKKGLK